MIPNNKYFTAAEIYVRLLSSFPKKGTEISKINVMRWCSEVVTELLTDPVGMIPHYKIQLGTVVDGIKKIIDGKVELPIDVFKFLRARFRAHIFSAYKRNDSVMKVGRAQSASVCRSGAAGKATEGSSQRPASRVR